MTHRISTRPKRAALALACAGALSASLAVGGIAHAADTSQPAAQPTWEGIVWLDDLLHPLDITDAFMVHGTLTSRVGSGDGTYGLSACTGETRMSEVVGPDANLFFGVFSGRDDEDGKTFTMPEHVADQASDAQALGTYNTIVHDLRGCQDEPAGHWHYGVFHREQTSVAHDTWAVTFDGDGTRDGGVIMAQTGRHLAVVEVEGAGTFRQMISLVAGTVSALR